MVTAHLHGYLREGVSRYGTDVTIQPAYRDPFDPQIALVSIAFRGEIVEVPAEALYRAACAMWEAVRPLEKDRR